MQTAKGGGQPWPWQHWTGTDWTLDVDVDGIGWLGNVGPPSRDELEVVVLAENTKCVRGSLHQIAEAGVCGLGLQTK